MTKQALHFYWQFYEGKRLSLLLTSCLLILQPVALSATLLAIKRLFDNLLQEDALASLLLISLGLIVLYLFSGGLALFVRYRMMQLTHEAIQNLRRELANRLYAFSRTQYVQFDRKQLQTVLVQDVIRVDVMTNALAGQLIPGLVIALSITAVLLYLNFQLFLVVILSFPLLFLIELAFRSPLRRLIQGHHRLLEHLQKQTLFGLEAMDLTHARGAEHVEIEAQVGAGERFRQTSTRLAILREGMNFAQDVLMLIITVLCLLVGGWFVLEEQMSVGELFVFYAAIVVLRPYVRSSWATLPAIIEGVEALKTLNQWQAQPHAAPRFGQQKISFSGEVCFQQVQFAYGERPLLAHIDLHIRAGAMAAILGPNGAGKSTLAYLLLGFYQPHSGTILVNGRPLNSLNISHFRQQIGVVPQQPFIFHGTVWENIVYGVPHSSQESVLAAARLAEADDFIQLLPAGYETVIGDDGMSLSGGQRQRLALARALLTRPPFLILDEPTNHLDEQAIQQIMQNLRQTSYRPTCLLITHDLSAAAFWDETYLLENGRLSPYQRREKESSYEIEIQPE